MDLIEFLFDENIIRIEYEAVIPIDEIIIKVSKHSSFEEIIVSIMTSFEKNPEVKGNPIKAAFVIIKVDDTKGIFKLFNCIMRMSW